MEGYAVQSGVQETRRRLRKAGFKGDDLEAMTEVIAGMEERLATKEDLARTESVLRQEIAGVRTELRRDIANLREEVKDRFDGFRLEIGGKIDGLRSEIRSVDDGLKGQIDGIRWMIGLLLALTVPTLATLIALALR